MGARIPACGSIGLRHINGARALHVGTAWSRAAGSDDAVGGGGPLRRYQDLVAKGDIKEDPRQLSALVHLQQLHEALIRHDRIEDDWMVSWGLKQRQAPPQGVYMFGDVGCGKTFLMDMLFQASPVTRKRRVHFHDFMLEVHDRLHKMRQQGHKGDPLPRMAKDLMEEAWFLCFDEFQVTDIADAMVMGRLFSSMFDAGLVMVATSNRPPDDLYKNGLQRKLFLPFIETLKTQCFSHDLDSAVDYRLLGTDTDGTYLWPLSDAADAAIAGRWETLSKREVAQPATLRTQGRQVQVPVAALSAKMARFTFQDLCCKPLGAADYIVIAKHFSTVFITDIPLLSLESRNETRRFITLIDTLYNHHVKLVCTAAGPAMYLFSPDGHDEDGRPIPSESAWGNVDEVFAFERTVSRLTEMRSEEYLAHPWTPDVQLDATERARWDLAEE